MWESIEVSFLADRRRKKLLLWCRMCVLEIILCYFLARLVINAHAPPWPTKDHIQNCMPQNYLKSVVVKFCRDVVWLTEMLRKCNIWWNAIDMTEVAKLNDKDPFLEIIIPMDAYLICLRRPCQCHTYIGMHLQNGFLPQPLAMSCARWNIILWETIMFPCFVRTFPLFQMTIMMKPNTKSFATTSIHWNCIAIQAHGFMHSSIKANPRSCLTLSQKPEMIEETKQYFTSLDDVAVCAYHGCAWCHSFGSK